MQVTNTTSILNSTPNNLLSKEDDKVLDNTFESMIENNKTNEKEELKNEIQEREKLVKDILSLLKTGFTEEELKNIEKLLQELESLKKKRSSGGNVSPEDIDEILRDMKETLIKAQEKATGRSVRDTNENNNELLPIQKDFEEKINGLKDVFNKNGTSLKESQLLSINMSDQIKLMEQLKQKR